MVVSAMQAIQLAKTGADAGRRQSGSAAQQTQGGAAQSLSMSQAETMMQHLVAEGWLEKSRKGYYSLSPRGLMELRQWLVATYNEENDEGRWVNRIKFCSACGDIVTVVSLFDPQLCCTCELIYIQGQRCGDRDCPGRLHEQCIRNSFRVQRAEKCPICRSDWPGDKYVGEKAVTSTEQDNPGRRRSTNAHGASNAAPAASQNNREQSDDENSG